MCFGIQGRMGAWKEQQPTRNICWLAGKQCQVQAEEMLTVLPKFTQGELSDRPPVPNAVHRACFWPSRWVWGAQQAPAVLGHENGRSWLTITILCCSSLHLWGKMGMIEGGMKMPSRVWIIPFEATMSRIFKGIPDSSIRILPWCRNTILAH